MSSIALFGGSFDPIHNGHLQCSKNIQAHFHFNHYYFLPCKLSPLKSNSFANTSQRITMLQLAIKQLDGFSIDLREIERETPSYTIDTLTSVRAENRESSITLIIGYDAFLTLPKWHRWDELIEMAHLLVINREQFAKNPIPKELQTFLKAHQVHNKTALLANTAGAVMFYDAGNYEISSTAIREGFMRGDCMKNLLPAAVNDYVLASRLYQ